MIEVMDVVVNGESHAISEQTSIAGLLESLDLNSKAVAVELNLEIQPRDTHQQVILRAGDVLEIVSLVGGG